MSGELTEARETIATLRDAYRDAIGVPESEHQRRRMEAIATAYESLLDERDALRAQVERVRALVDRWDEPYVPYGAIHHASELHAALDPQ